MVRRRACVTKSAGRAARKKKAGNNESLLGESCAGGVEERWHLSK